MSDPRRVNLADFRQDRAIYLPDDVVRVDRRSKWGNPHRIGDLDPAPVSFRTRMGRDRAIHLYRPWLSQRLAEDPLFLEPLRGKRLACWCVKPLACHVDVLLAELDRSERPA